MKKRKVVFGLLIIVLFLGCVRRQSERNNRLVLSNNRLVLYNDYHRNKIFKTDSIYLTETIKNDSIHYIYKLKAGDTLGYSFSKSIDNDSSINIYGMKCPLISSKTFKIRNREFNILKYYYDEENSYDEETNFFFHQDYGLLVAFNVGWLILGYSMECDSISKILIDSIISDRTGFYLKYIPPPPPPPDEIYDRIINMADSLELED